MSDIAPHADMWQHIYEDAATYGRTLFDHTFRDEQMETLLSTLPANERLLLVADDPLVASIPWEYLRDGNNKLLASRLNVVRGLPVARRRAAFEFSAPLEIVTVPVSPIDEPVILDVEREWTNLIAAVKLSRPPKSLMLNRVRPPTLSQLERDLGSRGTSIVHFMGHSTSQDGKAFLAFEDARARGHLIGAADFIESLNPRVFLVILNSCLSAVVAHTEFGNIAQALTYSGVPYALGMQFILPDAAALELSKAFYDFLLQERTVEEAVRRTRRALEEPGKGPGLDPAWLAGIPVLYTSLQAPAPAIELSPGQPTIQPDPEQLELTCDLSALKTTQHFVGRSEQVSKVVGILLDPHQRGFVLLHGLGGIGKTALARAVAERLSYHYGDRVLTYSFETFARLDANNQRVIDETFTDRFINRLARFYGLDAQDANRYPNSVALQQAIIQRRAHLRSLLVLDNLETLLDAQASSPAAQSLATFVARLNEGDGAVLLTSRNVPPSDWGECQRVSLTGLKEEAGAELFLALLPADREHLAPPDARKALSERVAGHPLSIQLLAGRFADKTATDLATFLKSIEAELAAAEQATPTSMEDPQRQKTLYACLDYSIKRLTTEQRILLDAISLFQTPFPPEFPSQLLKDEAQTPTHLQTLVRLSLLEISLRSRTFQEGELILLELHPTVRWYIEQYQSEPGAALREQYGEIYASLASQAFKDYDRDARLRYLLNQSLPDCEAAIQCLPPARKSNLTYHLASPYQRLGQNKRALALYELSLEIDQELGDVRGVAVTQNAMANVLMQQGKPQEAMVLYEQSLRTTQELGEVQGVAVTQANLSQLLFQQGEQQRALSMAWQAYTSLDEHGYASDAQIMQQLLITIKRQEPGPEAFDALWSQLFHYPQPDWLANVEAPARTVSEEMIQAVRDFVNTDSWQAARAVVEEQQAMLYRPEVEALFERNIAQARADGEERAVRLLEVHLALLRACKASGIEEAFAQLAAAQEGEATDEDEDVEDALPFDPQLISRTITAFLGAPQERMTHMQYLAAIAGETADEDLKALINTIQLAMFGNDLSQFGRDLNGVYRQAWETIVASVEAGGVDPRTFETIAANTLAVLGPAANRRNEWRGNLADVRNHSTARGDRNMAALLDAVIGLLDAGGEPAGLGEGFKGIYARTWQAIVDGLPK